MNLDELFTDAENEGLAKARIELAEELTHSRAAWNALTPEQQAEFLNEHDPIYNDDIEPDGENDE